jgi:hypothetical protein
MKVAILIILVVAIVTFIVIKTKNPVKKDIKNQGGTAGKATHKEY